MKRIALIQVWFGKIPDYFEYHYHTCKNLDIDFFIFSDREFDEIKKYDAPNFTFVPITFEKYQELLSEKVGFPIKFLDVYKVTETKPSYPDVFYPWTKSYEFVGWYDIDTLFGDVVRLVEPYLNDYDVISFGEKHKFYNRVSGPLTIVRNTEEIRSVYKNDPAFKEGVLKPNHSGYDEKPLNDRYKELKIKVKLLYNAHNCDPENLKSIFDATWSGGKVFVDNEEKLLYHFYYKKHTKFEKHGNSIVASQKIDYLDDFVYVTYFTEDYEKMARLMIRSLSKYSTRKCLLYTVNYTSTLEKELSDQFIVRRIDLDDLSEGTTFKTHRSAAFNVLLSKPVIQLDSLNALPNSKFVFIDTDIYVTANIDSIDYYFHKLENYPLINSHIHDVLYIILDKDMENGISPLHVLGKEIGVDITVFPRRKANVMIYDKRAKWFFEEMLKIYTDNKNSTTPYIFGLHDEDLFNIMLSKHNFQESLPVIDIEQEFDLNFDIINKYTYNMTNPSVHAQLPKIDRDVLVFHGYRKPEEFEKVDKTYGAGILDKSDILLEYDGKDFAFIKNSFLFDKKISGDVRVTVTDGKEFYSADWKIFEYRTFFLWNIYLPNNKVYTVELTEIPSGRLIYHYDYLTDY